MLNFRSFLEINLDNLSQNYHTLQKLANKSCKLGSVVKANAYGLGAKRIVAHLHSAGCQDFFVSNLDEALEIRDFAFNSNIYILTGFAEGELGYILNNNFIPVIFTHEQLEQLVIAATRQACPQFCIKFDTGMRRLGFAMQDLTYVRQTLDDNPSLKAKVRYIISHLANAENSNDPRNLEQFNNFELIKQGLPGFKYSFANSSGIFLGVQYQEDLARPGAFLYGICESEAAADKQLIVARKYAEVVHKYINPIPSHISYGSSRKIDAGMKVIVARLGYADGYFRGNSNQSFMSYLNHKLPVIGSVTMDMTMLDASHLTDTEFAECKYVEVFGDSIKIQDIAKHNDTISYEILLGIGVRFNRKYVLK